MRWKCYQSKWWYDYVVSWLVDLGPFSSYMKGYRLWNLVDLGAFSLMNESMWMWSLDLVVLGTVVMYVYEWIKEWKFTIGRRKVVPSMKDLYKTLNVKRRIRMSYPNIPCVTALVDPFFVRVL